MYPASLARREKSAFWELGLQRGENTHLVCQNLARTSIPSLPKPGMGILQRQKQQDQDLVAHSLHNSFEASLGYTRPYLKERKFSSLFHIPAPHARLLAADAMASPCVVTVSFPSSTLGGKAQIIICARINLPLQAKGKVTSCCLGKGGMCSASVCKMDLGPQNSLHVPS